MTFVIQRLSHATMALALAVAIVLATAGASHARPLTLGLRTSQGVLSDWHVDTPNPAAADSQIVEFVGESGRPAVNLRWAAPSPPTPGAFVALSQLIDAAAYRGKRIRLEAMAKAVPDRPGRAGLVLRIDGPDRSTLFFDNMADRPIRSEAWAPYVIEANVPTSAVNIYVGLLDSGAADASFSEVPLSAIGDSLPTSPDAAAYLNRALDLLRLHHLRSSEADWPDLRRAADQAIAGAQTSRETYPAIRLVLTRLGERHSGLVTPQVGPAPASKPQPLPTASRIGGIGVLRVTPLSTLGAGGEATAQTYLSTLHEDSEHLKTEGVCGWIVDLRTNGGGNMWPMLNGLRDLLGGPPFGAFVNAAGAVSPWVERSGVIGQGPFVTTPSSPADTGHGRGDVIPVAVLIGPHTASSGEMVAIAFHGRQKTRSFGAPTAGLVTANEIYELSDGALLVVTSGWARDRTGETYSSALAPDVPVPPSEAEVSARQWLASEGCR